MRYLFFIFLFCSISGFTQFGFDKIDHDFGDIYAGNDRVIDLKFRNTTPKKVYLLRVKHGREIKTLVSTKTIEPDSLLIIRIKYNPTDKGRFKVKIPVYLSNSMEPFVFTIQGNVKEIDNSMGLACPSFDNPNIGGSPIFKFKATVLDKATGDPIKDASITFVHNGMTAQIEKTNRRGRVTTNSIIGLYYFVINAEGYIGTEFPRYVNKNKDSILVYLDKPITEKEPLVEIPIQEKPETVDTLSKTTFEFPLEDEEIAKKTFEFPIDTQNIEEPIVVEIEPEITDTVSKKTFEFPVDTQVVVKETPVIKKDTVSLPVVTEKPKVVTYKSNNIVFLLDVSTSMNTDGKLDLLKASLIAMVKELKPEDKITLISYSTFSKVIVEAVSGSEKDLLIETIQKIKAQGMTAGGDGMKLGYRQAKKHFIEGGNNQVIMATDGRFNKGNTKLDRLVVKNFDKGIGLTVLGIKNKPEDAEEMQGIASLGGGNFLLIDSYEDSKDMLINEIKRTSRVVR